MLKKIVLAAALCATASFAFWDMFPVLENHKGEAEVGVTFEKAGDDKALVPHVGTRYTILQNLELAAFLPYYVILDDAYDNGVMNPILMARYQFLPIMNAYLDVRFPINGDVHLPDNWKFAFGLQYSQKISIVNLGSFLGASVSTSGENSISPPVILEFGAEADLDFSYPVIPFVGADVSMEIGKYTKDGKNLGGSHTGHLMAAPFAGLLFQISPTFSVKTRASTLLGKKDHVGEHTRILLSATVDKSF